MYLSLGNRHGNGGENASIGLYARVITVGVIMLEIFVKQIAHSDR
jgi:hypothetical protein